MNPERCDASVTVGTERETAFSVSDLLRDMDAAGIQKACLLPEDRELVVENQSGNRRIAKLAAEHPDRFIAGFSINPWWGPAAARAWADEAVGSGAKVLLINPLIQGFHAGDHLADWLWEWAAESRIPVHLRVGPSASSTPSQAWFLSRRQTNVRWIFGGGGVTDYSYDLAPVWSKLQGNVWFETSMMRPSTINAMMESVPHDRIIFGSGAPRQDLVSEAHRLAATIPQDLHPGVFGGNFLELLK